MGGSPPCEQCRCANGLNRFEPAPGCEEHSGTKVEPEQHRAFAFIAKKFRMRFAAARGDFPVEVAHIVAGLIKARLLEFHTASAKSRQPLTAAADTPCIAGKYLPPRMRAQCKQFLQPCSGWQSLWHLRCRLPIAAARAEQTGEIHGTATRCSRLSMTVSVSMPSASAS